MSEPMFIDLETTGLNPKTDRILELGMIVKDMDISLLISQDNPIPEFITELTGITDAMVADEGCSILRALAFLQEGFSEHLIIGHNILAFDYPFLLAEAERSGIDLDIDYYRFIDTAVMYLGHKMLIYPYAGEPYDRYAEKVMRKRPGSMKYNLGLACHDMGIAVEGLPRHRAVADCYLTKLLYEALWAVMPEPVKPSEGVGVVRL